MSKTKIVIIQLKEIIYTAIFVGLGILLILLLIFMFLPKKENTSTSPNSKQYKAGKYTTQLILNDTTLNLEVVVDRDNINSVSIANLDEDITTMYPLVKPALEEITAQLYNNTDVKDIQLSADSKYTQQLLLDGITTALDNAVIQ